MTNGLPDRDNFYTFCTAVHKKFHAHIYEREKNGGAEP